MPHVSLCIQGAAEWMKEELPFGHGYVCLDVAKLPTTFKEIFSNATAQD
jgi:hypothetical protein